MRDFSQRTVVITGAGSGIGRALAVQLAQRGADVALVDVNAEGLAETAAMIKTRVSTYTVDVSDRAAMEALPERVLAEHGRIDVVINNAGVTVTGTFEEQSVEDFEWLFGINWWGVVYGCKFFLPALKRSDDAYIVNLSSMFGLVGVPRQTSYCATKFAVRGFSEALAAELAQTSVRVLSVHPGGISTNIVSSARFLGDSAGTKAKATSMFKKFMPPTTAAEHIIKAMTNKRERLLITRETYGLDAIKRVFPTINSRVLSWAERMIAKR